MPIGGEKYYLPSESDRAELKKMRQEIMDLLRNPRRSDSQEDTSTTSNIYIAKTPTDGILAIAGDIVSFADCDIYKIVPDGDDLILAQVETLTQRVYNVSSQDIPEDTFITIKLDKYGYWTAFGTPDTDTSSSFVTEVSVQVATTENVDIIGGGISAGNVIDGYTLIENDIIAVLYQDDPTENWVYIVPAFGQPTATIAPFGPAWRGAGRFISVQYGDENKGTMWMCRTRFHDYTVGQFAPVMGVDVHFQRIDFAASSHLPCRAATTANVTLSIFAAGVVHNGLTLAEDDRWLVGSQSDPSENGIYDIHTGIPPTRALDADTWTKLAGTTVIVQEGSFYPLSLWMCSSLPGGTLETDDVTWERLSPLPDDTYGDIVVSDDGLTWTIDTDTVTYAKMQNVSATSRILGRKTSGAGDVEECTLSEILDFIGSAAQGDILYRGASGWARLGAGTSGHFLKTQGTSADPVWASASGASYTAGNAINGTLLASNIISVVSATNPGALTDSSGGTAGGTIGPLSGVSYAVDLGQLRNNFASLTVKLNAILTALHNSGVMT